MAWYTKIVLLCGSSLGLVAYLSLGFFIECLPMLRKGTFPEPFLVPITILMMTSVICWILFLMRDRPFQFEPFHAFTLILMFLVGVVLSNRVLMILGPATLQEAWEEALKEGRAVEPPPTGLKDPGEDNGVTWLRKIFDATGSPELKEGEIKTLREFIVEARDGKIDPAKLTVVKKVLAENEKILGYMEKAARCPKIDWQPVRFGIEGSIPRFSRALNAGRMAACRSIVMAHEKNYAEAAHWSEVGLWTAKALFRPKLLIGDMVGVALYRMMVDAVQYRFVKLPGRALGDAWDKNVLPEEPVSTFRDSFSLEYLYSGKLFAEHGTTYFGGDSISGQMTQFIIGPFVYFDSALRIHLSKDLVMSFTLPYARFQKAYDDGYDLLQTQGWLFTQIALPRFDQMYVKTLTLSTYLRLSRVGLAAKAFHDREKRWPLTLAELEAAGAKKEDLIDPFTGGSIHLKADHGLLLYSAGQDMKDDGGLVSEKGNSDIVFRVAS